jgi:putative endonuclease
MWHVYILRSLQDGGFYIGCTNNLERRILEHERGYNISTRLRWPFELVYKEVYNQRSDAFAREKQIKSYKGGKAFHELLRK